MNNIVAPLLHSDHIGLKEPLYGFLRGSISKVKPEGLSGRSNFRLSEACQMPHVSIGINQRDTQGLSVQEN